MEAELEQTVMRPDAGARGHGGSGGRAGELRACVESGRGRLAGARAGAVACADARVEGPGSGGVERLGGRVAGSLRVVWGGRRWPAVAGDCCAAAGGAGELGERGAAASRFAWPAGMQARAGSCCSVERGGGGSMMAAGAQRCAEVNEAREQEVNTQEQVGFVHERTRRTARK
nr:uncharacterized protein LOC127332227 [Lolium perenne]